jgi:hypothetical protein
MACYGLEPNQQIINLPPGVIDVNGNNTLSCCECLCDSACTPSVLSNQWAVPNGGTISFASTFSTCYPQLVSNCPNMAWVLNGWNGGGGYGSYAYGTFDANGCLVVEGTNPGTATFNVGSSSLTSNYGYSDAVSVVAYDPSDPTCSPSSPPNPPSICGNHRVGGIEYPGFLCASPPVGACESPVGIDNYGTCCACTT